MTKRGRAPDPDTLIVEHVGLGYTGSITAAGIAMSIDRLVQQRGELVGELTVERAPEGHVFIGRFNLSSVDARRRTAQYLGERTNNVEWRDVLEEFCLAVLRDQRAGQPFVQVGQAPPSAELRYVLYPLLPADRPTIVFGEGGVGKSTLAAATAVTVASGVTAIDRWHCDEPGPVLVIDWEADADEWNDLVAAISRGIGIKPPKDVHYRPGAGPLTDQLDDVAQHVAQHGVRLLLIDSVGLAMPSRNEGADANEAALRLFAALRHIGVTTLLIDHVAGADMGVDKAIVKPYGSVYKFNLARNLFELRSHTPSADGTLHLGLYHRKSNRTAKLGPIGLAVHHGPGEILIEQEELEAAEANAAIPLHRRIHTLLLAGGKTPSQIAEAVDSTPGSVRGTLDRMLSLGMATKLPTKLGREHVWGAVANWRSDEPQHETQQVRLGQEGDPWG